MKPQKSDNLKPLVLITLLLSACLLAGQPSGHSRDQIDSDQRLNMLNRATGKESTTNTFQARLDAILDTTATPERSYVGTQDEAIRQKAAVAKKEAADKEFLRQSAPRPGKDTPKVKDTQVKLKTDMTEKNYLAEREKIRKANAERLRDLKTTEDPRPKEKSPASDSKVSMSLKNNPFYHGNFSKNAQFDFEDQKPVLISRLIQQNGMDQIDAERLVSQAASPEDLTIRLMEDQGWTFQEANEVTGS